MRAREQNDTQLIKAAELRRMLGGISRGTLQKWLDAHEFPAPILIGRSRHWFLDDVRKWLAKLPRCKREEK